jgi:hypothetical protein
VYAVAQAPNTIEFRAAALALVVSPHAVQGLVTARRKLASPTSYPTLG